MSQGMSWKNHVMVDGRLFQTDKRFSALKEKQKMQIAEWFYEAYKSVYMEFGKLLSWEADGKILADVFQKISKVGIWIPDGEIYFYYRKRKGRLQKRLEKERRNEIMEG